jgi:hypothetical protein
MVKGFFEIGKLAKIKESAALHTTEFEVPLYNIWKQQEKTPAVATLEIQRCDGLIICSTSIRRHSISLSIHSPTADPRLIFAKSSGAIG